jgi:outer membrane protein assembly factor BamA
VVTFALNIKQKYFYLFIKGTPHTFKNYLMEFVKTKFVLLFILLMFFAIESSYAKKEKKDSIKTGWNFGALPAISFDSDRGFQYGALVNLFYYGDGSNFPDYNHSLYFEASTYTKGSSKFRFNYDSEYLIPGIIVSADISWLPDLAYDFYGFNGYEAVLNKSWEEQSSPDYRSRVFYKYQNNMLRFKVDLQGPLKTKKLRWLAGINILNFDLASVDLDKLNKGKDEEDKLPDVPGLYEKYQQWDILDAEESDGGFVPLLKAGLVYDTRDNRPNPMKGIWTEAVMAFAPGFLGAESSFTKLSITHRQYFTLIKNDLSFAYRLAWQQTISGHVPFYFQNQIITSRLTGSSSIGLGGSKTLRGMRRNRAVGDGIFYGNAELRWKVLRFNFAKQQFYCGLNGFTDFGRVTGKIQVEDKIDNVDEPIEDYFNFGAERMHFTAGTGFYLAMNYNFIVSMDVGFALDEQDGDRGIYIGLNYLF